MTEKRRALITGVTGQDGSYLTEYLLGLGYEVWGLQRRTSLDPNLRLESIVHSPSFHIVYGNLQEEDTIKRALMASKPHEIYNLAALSDVGISFMCPEETMDVNYEGLGRIVRNAREIVPDVHIYQASTSEMYGSTPPPQNETSPFSPVSPYAEAKLKAHEEFVKGYRDRYGLYICSGILFNHESPRRGLNFVTRKITTALAKIKVGKIESFALGNLEAKRDWGFAGDYVKAMHMMLNQGAPQDYVISTGESHSVREFVEAACRALGIEIAWEGEGLDEIGKDQNGKTIITINKDFYRPAEVRYLLGDSSKARRELGWQPEITFTQLVEMMAKTDFEIQKGRK